MNRITVNFSVVSCVSVQYLDELRGSLQHDNYRVFELDGKTIEDPESFFQEVKRVLPLDPPLSGSWDAFADSLWGGIDKLASPRIAIIWKDSERMVGAALSDFLTAIDCLLQVARNVATQEFGVSVPTKLLVFLMGNGVSYKPLLPAR